jgi:hypothetical protein
MRQLLLVSLAILTALLAAQSAQAQGFYGRSGPPNYGPGYRPQLSPYLDIIRGRNFGVDYYLGTRQEFIRRQNTAAFASEIDELRSREGGIFEAGVAERPVQSGTPTAFGNTLGYYNNPVNFVAPPVTGTASRGGSMSQAQAFSQGARGGRR